MNQKPETLYHCKLCGRNGFVKRGQHRPPPGVAGKHCPGDFVELKPQSCFNCNFKATSACPDPHVINREPWNGCQAWFRLPSVPSVPSVAKDSILTKDQAALVDDVKTYHAGVRRSYEHQVQYAFMAGLKLTALKDSCPHGNSKEANGEGFVALCARELPDISRSSAKRYMDFTNLLLEIKPSVGFIRGSNLLLENGDLPTKEKEAVLKAVYEAADGKTWTAFYRDLNLVREKQPASHHPRNPNPKAEIDPDAPDGALWKSCQTDILILIHPDETELEEQDTNDLKRFLTVLQAGVMRVSSLLKARRAKPAPKQASQVLLTAEANLEARQETAVLNTPAPSGL